MQTPHVFAEELKEGACEARDNGEPTTSRAGEAALSRSKGLGCSHCPLGVRVGAPKRNCIHTYAPKHWLWVYQCESVVAPIRRLISQQLTKFYRRLFLCVCLSLYIYVNRERRTEREETQISIYMCRYIHMLYTYIYIGIAIL